MMLMRRSCYFSTARRTFPGLLKEKKKLFGFLKTLTDQLTFDYWDPLQDFQLGCKIRQFRIHAVAMSKMRYFLRRSGPLKKRAPKTRRLKCKLKANDFYYSTF